MDSTKKIIQIAYGLTALGAEKTKKVVDNLRKDYKITPESSKKAAKEFLHDVKKSSKDISSTVEKQIETILDKYGYEKKPRAKKKTAKKNTKKTVKKAVKKKTTTKRSSKAKSRK